MNMHFNLWSPNCAFCEFLAESATSQKRRSAAESTSLLFFFDFLRTNSNRKYCPKLLQYRHFWGKRKKKVNYGTKYGRSGTVCEIPIQKIIYVVSQLKLSWNPQLKVDSANGSWNLQMVGGIRVNLRDSPYIWEIRLLLRNPEQLPLFARCGLHNKTNVPKNYSYR